jgi:hypothetical protein
MRMFPSRRDDRIVSLPELSDLQFSVVRKVAFEGRTFFNRPIRDGPALVSLPSTKVLGYFH